MKDPWSNDVKTYMHKHKIHALRLSDSFGFKGHDVSFLSELTFLRSLELYCWKATGIRTIESLHQLEALGLQYKSTQKVDLSAFSKLKFALITWSKGLSLLFNLPSLKKLNIQNYPYSNLTPMSKMTALRQIYLTSRKLESLEGIEHLTNLELLDLNNCPFLTSAAETKHCPKLRTIEIGACNRIQPQ